LHKETDYFKLSTDVDEFYFINKESSADLSTDIKINAVQNILQEDGYDYSICSNIEEPLHYNTQLTEFLDNGNLILSSTYFETYSHKNLYVDYLFSLYYFFHSKGFNYLNFYESSDKDGLVGTYNKETSKLNKANGSMVRDKVSNCKELLGDDLIDYGIPEFPMKNLFCFQPKDNKVSLDMWKNNYISSYTDIVRNVCFYIIETWPGNGNQGRDYITEKTLKSILFSKVKSFPILDASNKIMNLMKKDGFWFLNNEFNNITETFKYLKELKNKHKVYALVYEDLLETYGNKLDNNSKILDKLLLKHPKSEYLLKFIKKDLDI
jgi:hypothetical protein